MQDFHPPLFSGRLQKQERSFHIVDSELKNNKVSPVMGRVGILKTCYLCRWCHGNVPGGNRSTKDRGMLQILGLSRLLKKLLKCTLLCCVYNMNWAFFIHRSTEFINKIWKEGKERSECDWTRRSEILANAHRTESSRNRASVRSRPTDFCAMNI